MKIGNIELNDWIYQSGSGNLAECYFRTTKSETTGVVIYFERNNLVKFCFSLKYLNVIWNKIYGNNIVYNLPEKAKHQVDCFLISMSKMLIFS